MILVILIHSLGFLANTSPFSLEWGYGITLRQFINFAVPVFFFIAGYFSFNDKYNCFCSFLKKRLIRIMSPYLLWTFLYSVILLPFKNHDFSLRNLFAETVLGSGIGVGYFVVVLIQFTLLTPFLYKIKTKKIHFFIIAIISVAGILFTYTSNFSSYLTKFTQFPYSAIFFFVWYPFYHLGFYINKYKFKFTIDFDAKLNAIIIFSLVFMSLSEAYYWGRNGDYSFAVSQLKFTSLSLSLYLCLFMLRYVEKKVNAPIFEYLGKLSYGIYLTHMLFVWLFYYSLIQLNVFIAHEIILVMTVFVLSTISVLLFCHSLNKLLNPRVSQYIIG